MGGPWRKLLVERHDMTKDRQKPRICGQCGRVAKSDLARGYCPISANCIHAGMSAANCKMFLEKKDNGRKEDVR